MSTKDAPQKATEEATAAAVTPEQVTPADQPVPAAEQPTEPVEEQPKPVVMSYDPAMLPPPVNQHDEYVRAALIEQRASRKALADIASELKKLNAALAKGK